MKEWLQIPIMAEPQLKVKEDLAKYKKSLLNNLP